jgi:hypothetical protein
VALAISGGCTSWWITNYPLARPYALDVGTDRTANIQLVQVVAAGNGLWSSGQPGQYSFEPFWGVFVSALAGFDPTRVIPLYPYLALIPIVLFPLAVWRGLADAGLDDWERAFAAWCGALLLGTAIDYSEHFRDPWQMSFLFKPNHALGFVIAPLVLAAFARATRARGLAATGVALGFLGWVCVFHMVFVWAGLCALAAHSILARERAAETIRRVAWTGLTSLVIAAPHLYVLLFLYPAGESGPRYGNPVEEAWALWPTLQSGPLFLLAVAGAWEWTRRRGELARTWVAMAAGALAFWALLYVLGLSFRARERDELVYWIRLLTALLAGIGAWRTSGVALEALGRGTLAPALRALLLVAVTLPFTHPLYWDPQKMDQYFRGAREPLPELYPQLGAMLMARTAPQEVIACDPAFGRYVSAFGARRVYYSRNLNNSKPEQLRRDAVLRELLQPDPAVACAAAARAGVSHLVLTPAWIDQLELDLEDFRARGAWRFEARAGAAPGEDGGWAELYALRCPR